MFVTPPTRFGPKTIAWSIMSEQKRCAANSTSPVMRLSSPVSPQIIRPPSNSIGVGTNDAVVAAAADEEDEEVVELLDAGEDLVVDWLEDDTVDCLDGPEVEGPQVDATSLS